MENEIWALEEAWYTHHCNGVPEKAYALLHDRFIGRPAVEAGVMDAKGMISFIADEDAESDSYTFELGREGIQVIGDTAINHYTVRFIGKNQDGSEINECLRVSHTWVKENAQWKFLSGMACEVDEQ
jgi:ketosteroid isomerase-like protein